MMRDGAKTGQGSLAQGRSTSTGAPLLLHVFPTFDPGGAQSRFVALANHFGRRLRHVVIAMDGRLGCAEQLDAKLDFRCLTIPVRKNTMTGNLGTLRKVLREERPRALITHNWGTIEWALAKTGSGIRHIHIEDGFGPDEAERQLTRRVLARRVLLRNSSVVVPSRELETIAHKDWHIAPSRLRYVPNGIDLDRFARPVRPDGGALLPSDIPVVGTVSALRAEKNLSRLLHAMALTVQTTPCRLEIVGDGPQRPMLAALAQELGLAEQVQFAGHTPDPSALYATFDVFALTSDTEQMPYTVLEAMAASCPIVATDVGDIRGMVSPENEPFIVERSDQAISDALLRLLADRPLREKIGAANFRKAQQSYSQDTMFRAFAEIYDAPGLTAA